MSIVALKNKLVQKVDGLPVRLAGLSLQDPLWQRLAPGPRLLPHGTINLEQAKLWGANTVRVPFHPVTIRFAGQGDWQAGLQEVEAELNWILLAAKALDLRVIIDFHGIGFPADETRFEFDEAPFQDLYRVTAEEIRSFWGRIASAFGSHPAVAAFELFNEATRGGAFGNSSDWALHCHWAESLLESVIRPQAPEVLVIVGGLHFGYDLEFLSKKSVRDHNIAYSSHPYPHHSQAKSWDRAFGIACEHYPVILTEIGFAPTGFFGRQHHRGFRDWELELKSYVDARHLSLVAWSFSHSWEPTLLEAQTTTPDFVPNEAGRFFQNWFREISESNQGSS